ncbi:MAG: hypothetical protein AB1610_00085 [Nitrospirota bacterium]
MEDNLFLKSPLTPLFQRVEIRDESFSKGRSFFKEGNHRKTRRTGVRNYQNSHLFRQYVNVTTEIVVIPAKAGIQRTFENTGFPPARLCHNHLEM